jgi:hypothetical protein
MNKDKGQIDSDLVLKKITWIRKDELMQADLVG